MKKKNSITTQLDLYLKTIRKWKRPWGEKRICSLYGTPGRSTRVPDHRIGPSETEGIQRISQRTWLAGWHGLYVEIGDCTGVDVVD
ncbi:phosphotransferase family protein [Aspergillus luchuensis]|uniref:Phosphotransferase family protein n=1 Tax=Aspergillus kawachii TaxID=1069201 RepID=A0A146FX87_ASPKA|nr:phosphotransferase family protein [Aspergillus luchuensis]